MSNASRIAGRSQGKKPRTYRSYKPKINFEALPHAIVEGKICVEPGGKIAVMRTRNGRSDISICEVKRIEDGIVHTWDETISQWFSFGLNDPVVARVLTSGSSAGT